MKAAPARVVAALACCALCALARAQTEPPEGFRSDDRRRDEPFTLRPFGVPLLFTGSWEFTDEGRDNFDQNNAVHRDRRVHEHEVKLEMRTLLGERTSLFLQGVGLYESRRTQNSGAPPQRTQSAERGQSWLKTERIGGSTWALQLGRVPLYDRRSWWWDEDLDAVRVFYGERGTWRLDTGLAREAARVSSADEDVRPEQEGVTRWFGQAGWFWTPRNALEIFWLNATDRSGAPAPGTVVASEDRTDPSDLRGRWLGLRASGEWRPAGGPRLRYRADLARLRGTERVSDFSAQGDGTFTAGASRVRTVRAHALDAGLTIAAPWWLRPSLTAAFARGSGGRRDDSLDENFRQTGLQENKARIAGVKRLRVYGELLRPELSNLSVATLATGLRLLENSSIELIGHRYRQPVPDTRIAGSRLSVEPLGQSGDIGDEIDVFLAVREWPRLELTLRWSRFVPGAAFAENRRDPARAVEVGVALNF